MTKNDLCAVLGAVAISVAAMQVTGNTRESSAETASVRVAGENSLSSPVIQTRRSPVGLLAFSAVGKDIT